MKIDKEIKDEQGKRGRAQLQVQEDGKITAHHLTAPAFFFPPPPLSQGQLPGGIHVPCHLRGWLDGKQDNGPADETPESLAGGSGLQGVGVGEAPWLHLLFF